VIEYIIKLIAKVEGDAKLLAEIAHAAKERGITLTSHPMYYQIKQDLSNTTCTLYRELENLP
jgi:hypothetical protein